MSFESVIQGITESPDTRQNILTDGSLTFAYSDLTVLLDRIDGQLSTFGINRDLCVGVECNNSVPAALLLLALLRKGQSFVLAPPPATNGDLKPTPRFCSHQVTVASSPAGVEFPPESCIRAEPNPQYNHSPSIPERLYLRTSGSMGMSKIVVHDHAKLMNNARNVIEKYGFAPDSRAAIPVPVAHMYGFGAEFLPAIIAGASIDLQDKSNLIKYLDRERRFKPTIVFATPGICDMLRKGFKTPRSTYKAFVTSGQRIGEEVFRSFDPMVGGRLINQYGSTEMGATAACDFSDSLDRRATAVGRPMTGVGLRLEPPPESAGSREVCELYCSHPWGFEGYMDEQGQWLAKASSDGWYRTGDLAVQKPDGSISVAGRVDASVNRSGYLVLLADIERLVESLDEVSEAAVVAGSGETDKGQRLAAFCVLKGGASLDGSQVRHRCFDLMPHYAIPDEVRVVGKLPLLASGKLDRRSLEALVRQD